MNFANMMREQDRKVEELLLAGYPNGRITCGKLIKQMFVMRVIKDALPPHLGVFLHRRQEVGKARDWAQRVAGIYVEEGQAPPSRQTMHRWWRRIVDMAVRVALHERML